MAQGLASPVMAYLILSLLISFAPERSSRGPGPRGAAPGPARRDGDLVATVPLVRPVSSNKQQSGVSERVEGN